MSMASLQVQQLRSLSNGMRWGSTRQRYPIQIAHNNCQIVQKCQLSVPILSPQRLDIMKLREKQGKQQINTLNDQIQAVCASHIEYEQFIRMFPTLKRSYCEVDYQLKQMAVRNLFRLFSGDQESMTRNDLLDGLVLFRQGNSDVMSRTIFWVYSNGSPEKALEKRIMNQSQLKYFLEDNRTFQLDNRTFQLQHTNVKSTKTQQSEEQNIKYSTFSKMFQLYNYLQIKQLVQWKGLGMECELAHTISTNTPILRKNGDSVYVLEYQWYLGWKKYMEKTYKVEIFVEDDKDITMSQFKESKGIRSKSYRESKDKQARSDLRQKGQNCNRPAQIKNTSLQGYYPNELKRDLVQFRDYILIPQFIWKMLYGIYKGGPVYKRTFPQIYSLSVIQVYIDKSSSFIPQNINDNLNIGITGNDESKTLKVMLEEDKKMDYLRETFKENSFVCYYRNSGRENWQLINSLEDDIVIYLSHHRTYICFMHRDQIQGFQARYNSQIIKNVRYIKNRIENYGSSLKLPIEDVMTKGSVIGLVDHECVIVEMQDRQGNYHRKRLEVQFLKKYNTSQIPNQPVVQPFAGMENLGNTCYMNAVVQCLIKTPHLGNFLAKQNYHREEHQQLLLDIFYQIFQRSRMTKQVIPTAGFKKVVQNHFPFFKGFSQQDAQQFLICMLSKISDELKQKPFLAFHGQKSMGGSRLKQSKIKIKNSMVQSVDCNDIRVDNPMQGQQLNKICKPNGHSSRTSQLQQNSQAKGTSTLPAGPQRNQQRLRDLRFFSGEIEIQTRCTKCLRKNSKNQESFFTYSLSLPEHKNKQYYFTYIPQLSRKSMANQHPSHIKSAYEPVRFGITLPNQVTLGQARGDMAKLIGIAQQNLYFAPVFNGEWMRGFSDEDMTKQMNFFANYNMTLVCYQIDYQDSPRYADFNRNDLEKKSIKVQVRHRYYNQKNQTFKAFFTPLLVEVDEHTKWKDIEKDIESTIDNFLDKQYLRDQSLAKSNRGQGENNRAGKTQECIDSEQIGRHRKESFIEKTSKFQHSLQRKPSQHQAYTNPNDRDKITSEIKAKRSKDRNTETNINLPSYHKRDQLKKSTFSSGMSSEEDGLLMNQNKNNNPTFNGLNNINKSSKIQSDVNPIVSKPYKIRLISKSDYNEDTCLICRDKFETLVKKDKRFLKRSFFSRAPCQGCVFQTDKPLFFDKEALYKAQNAIIVIDWQDHYAFKISSKFHSSYQQAKQSTAARVDKLEEILSENMSHEELVQMRCDREGCIGKEIIRTQRLKTSPNIFIIHLKRFRYDGNCLVKLMNPVQYPTELTIQNQNYLLYGVIIHNGTGMSGHYYCYVIHEGSWFKCDDQRVVPAVGNQYCDPKAYILFYKRADFEVSLIHLSF